MISDTSGGESKPQLEAGVYEGVAYMLAELGTNMHQFPNDNLFRP